MYYRCKAELEMKKVIIADGLLDMKRFQCEILKYDREDERIYLLLEDGELTDISLDAVYECCIMTDTAKVTSEGRILERYYNEFGKILEYQIENGFYKNNIKSVDKPEV